MDAGPVNNSGHEDNKWFFFYSYDRQSSLFVCTIVVARI